MNSVESEGFVNCVPVESFVGFCNHALGYSTEKPFEIQVTSHKVKPESGVGVGVSVGDGDSVGEGDGAAVGLGLGIIVGVGILVAVAFWWESCALLEALLRIR